MARTRSRDIGGLASHRTGEGAGVVVTKIQTPHYLLQDAAYWESIGDYEAAVFCYWHARRCPTVGPCCCQVLS